MVKLITLSSLVGAAAMQVSHGFVTAPQRAALSKRLSPPDNCIIHAAAADGDGDAAAGGVQTVSLAGLGDDHEAVGKTMGESVAAWLDAEWMPQDVHVRMGASVTNTYVACRGRGVGEVDEIMTEVTDDLFGRWSEYDADAFVNAWDIGNYVADYLISKSGSETCACSTEPV